MPPFGQCSRRRGRRISWYVWYCTIQKYHGRALCLAAPHWANNLLPRSDTLTASTPIGKLAAMAQPCIKLNTWPALCRPSSPSTPEAVACCFFLSAIGYQLSAISYRHRLTYLLGYQLSAISYQPSETRHARRSYMPFLHPSSGLRMFCADESHAPRAPSFRYRGASLVGRSWNLLVRGRRRLSPSSKASHHPCWDGG